MPRYGVSNNKSVVKMNQIIDKAIDSGIQILDTAPSYGKAESSLGQIKKDFKIITKFSKPPLKSQNITRTLEESIQSSLEKLQRSKIEYVLFHDTASFIDNFDRSLVDLLEDLKKNQIVEQFGFSVYSVEEVNLINDMISYDVLQFPLNPFNQKFVKGDLLKKLQSMSVETHARSIFLQGLLLSSDKRTNFKYYKKMQPYLDNWFSEVREYFDSPIDACLEFINQVEHLDHFIVGVTSNQELRQILDFQIKNKAFNFHQFDNNESLFDPRYWT